MMTLYAAFVLVSIQAVISSAVVTNGDLKKFADANNYLAASLYPKLIEGNSNNIFFAPLSLMTGLGVMMLGAKGNTQQELYSVLGYKAAGLDISKVPSTYKHYISHMLPQNNPRYSNYSLLCADEVLVTNRAQLKSKIQKEAVDYYESSIKKANFQHSYYVTGRINNFVFIRTYQNIKHMINNVDPSSSSVLINAAFFKGRWETPFVYTYVYFEKFHSPTSTRYFPFMKTVHSFPYYENSDYQAVFLPYVGGNVGLLILKPWQLDGLSNMEKTMTPKKIVKVMKNLKSQRTLVILPKFKFQYYRNFSGDFEELGAKSPYNGASADFSGLTTSKGLSISSTLYKGALVVDESSQGSEKQIDFNQPSTSSVVANYPFMFAVVDRRLNLIVFIGRFINV